MVAFESKATNLSTEDEDASKDVFTRNTGTRARRRSSAGSTARARAPNGDSFDPSISKSGLRIAFASDADNIFADDRDLYTNVFMVEPRFRFFTAREPHHRDRERSATRPTATPPSR